MFKNKKYYYVAFIISLLVTYTHCVVPQGSATKKTELKTEASENNRAPSGEGTSTTNTGNTTQVIDYKGSFQKTIWKVTNARCILCHGNAQQPLHGSNNIDTAFSAVMDGKKINSVSPDKSRLYLKLKDERHNCWSNCDNNADEMLQEIEDYVAMTKVVETIPDNTTMKTVQLGPLDNLQADSASLIFSADSFMLQAPFVKKGTYFTTQDNNGAFFNSSDNNAGRAFLNFSTSSVGTHYIWALVNAKASNDDSFFFKINNSKYYEWHIPETNGFEWRKLSDTTARNNVSINITNFNNNSLEVRQREDGTSLEKILITDDAAFRPQGNIADSFELSYDISQLLGLPVGSSKFIASIKEFDEYTYQVTKISIQTNSALRVKAPKILVNNHYTEQHNTYNYVNVNVPVGTTVLANYAMLVLKEAGSSNDLFSWKFDSLEKN